MARARLLKPGFFTNEVLAELPMVGRLLFAGLWCLADREGRLEDRPKRIEAELFPYDDVPIDALLDDLAAKKFILRYAVEGKRFLQVLTFKDHQHIHQAEAASKIPAPTGESPVITEESPVITGRRPAEALIGSLNQKPLVEAVRRRKRTPAASSVSAVLEDSGLITKLKARFPEVDVDWELQEKWCRHVETHPPKDYARAAINWLENTAKWAKERDGKSQGPHSKNASGADIVAAWLNA